MTRYLVNAGRLDADSWYRNEELEGSRFAGEGGHFIDTVGWWADSLPEEVYAVRGPEHDDVQVTVRLRNGSIGAITYVTGGNSRYPKETLDTAAGGRSARLDNFQSAAVWTGRRRSTMRSRGGTDKGQQRELPPSSRPSGPARRCPSRSSPWWPPPAPPSRWGTASRAAVRSGCDGAAAVAAGLVRAPGRPDVTGRGGLAGP